MLIKSKLGPWKVHYSLVLVAFSRASRNASAHPPTRPSADTCARLCLPPPCHGGFRVFNLRGPPRDAGRDIIPEPAHRQASLRDPGEVHVLGTLDGGGSQGPSSRSSPSVHPAPCFSLHGSTPAFEATDLFSSEPFRDSHLARYDHSYVCLETSRGLSLPAV